MIKLAVILIVLALVCYGLPLYLIRDHRRSIRKLKARRPPNMNERIDFECFTILICHCIMAFSTIAIIWFLVGVRH